MAEHESTVPPPIEVVVSPDSPEAVRTPINDEREMLVEAVDLLVQIGGLLLQNGAHAEYVEASLERLEAGLSINRLDAIVMSRSILLTATHRNLNRVQKHLVSADLLPVSCATGAACCIGEIREHISVLGTGHRTLYRGILAVYGGEDVNFWWCCLRR